MARLLLTLCVKSKLTMQIGQGVISDLSRGSNAAFGQVFRAFYPKTRRFAMMLLKDDADADDVCQLVFMKLWLHRERLAAVADFDAYLFMLAKHTIIDYLATNKLATIPIDDNIPDARCELTPHEQVVASDTQLFVDVVVENMPSQRQAVYRMSREQHMKNEDIAKALGLTKKTVENHLNLALKDIKKALRLAIFAIALWV